MKFSPGTFSWPGWHAAARLSILIAAIGLQVPGAGAQQDAVSGILERINEAYGGLERIQSIRTLEYEWAGYRISRHQSRRTTPPWDRVPVRTFIAVDYEQPRGVQDGVGNYPGGLVFPSRTIITADGNVDLHTERRTFHRGDSMYGIEGLRSQTARYLTPMLVRQMNRNRDRLEMAGTEVHFGTEYIRLNLGRTGVLVDPETALIYASLSSRHDMATNGTLQTMLIYPEHEVIDGIPWSSSLLGYLPGESVFTTDYRLTRLATNTDITPLLEIPEGFVEGANPHIGYGNDGALRVRPLGEGVFVAGDNNTNVLYVEFDNYFVAMETGGMAGYAESVHEAMRPHMGGKPLKYVIPTHYHDDHAVGIRYYVRADATILTTPEKAGYLRSLLQPVGNGERAEPLRLEWLEGDLRRFEDATGALHVLRYADAPHSENMFVGYLPKLDAVFSADIFIGWGGTGEVRQGASRGLLHYLAFLDEALGAKAASIKSHIPVHGRAFSAEEIAKMAGTRKTFVILPGNREVDGDNWFREYGLIDETTSGRRQRPISGS